jgi:uncharacterized protein (TIGR00251 family)
VILDLHVQPGASKNEFAGQHGERIKLRIRARAVDGAANEALVEFLARYFNVGRKSVRILSGERSRQKRVLVEGGQWPTKRT